MTDLDLETIRQRLVALEVLRAEQAAATTDSTRALADSSTIERHIATVDAPALLEALADTILDARLMAQAIANHTAAAGDEWEEGVRATLTWLRSQIEQRPAFAWYIADLLTEAETALLPTSAEPTALAEGTGS